MKTPVALLALICLSGCYPVYKTLQPSTAFVVVDESNKPIPDAEVFFISSAYPYGGEKSRISKFTDGLGKVRFNSIHEFRIESLMIHGREEFFWNWRVYKDGYETSQSYYTSSDGFSSENTVVLKKGNSQTCKPQNKGQK